MNEGRQHPENEVLKHDEKVEGRDALASISWALILIWIGAALLAINLGWFDAVLNCGWCKRILPDNMAIFEPSAWSVIMFGGGVILLAEAIVRVVVPQFQRNAGGTLILAAVFIGVGLGNFFGWDVLWPVVLIAVGVSVLAGGLARSRK
jgi:hypothetical protein